MKGERGKPIRYVGAGITATVSHVSQFHSRIGLIVTLRDKETAV